MDELFAISCSPAAGRHGSGYGASKDGAGLSGAVGLEVNEGYLEPKYQQT